MANFQNDLSETAKSEDLTRLRSRDAVATFLFDRSDDAPALDKGGDTPVGDGGGDAEPGDAASDDRKEDHSSYALFLLYDVSDVPAVFMQLGLTPNFL